jgi:3-oxoadipate enol-lactonase
MRCGRPSANGSTRFVTTAEDHGRSPATTKPYYEADDLAALLPDRKITHAALVASSHGGEVALNFLLRYTAYVSDLVLVGSAATGFPYSEYFLMRERENTQSARWRT